MAHPDNFNRLLSTGGQRNRFACLEAGRAWLCTSANGRKGRASRRGADVQRHCAGRLSGIPTDTSASFRYLSAGLREGLRQLGLHPGEKSGASRTRPAESALEPSGRVGAERTPSACFAAPAREEIVIEGRKAAGSAQWKSQGVIYKHGSIPLELDGDTLFRALQFENESARMLARKRFQSKATAINDILRGNGLQPIALRDLERAFGNGFRATLSGVWVEDELTASELDNARELVDETPERTVGTSGGEGSVNVEP